MLITCSSCNSKYLVNSADLKPDGRTVQCAKCGHNWFQIANIEDEEILSTSVPLTEKKILFPVGKGTLVNKILSDHNDIKLLHQYQIVWKINSRY